MKSFFTNPITIAVLVILILGTLALGYFQWGWFGGKRIDQSKGQKPDPADCGGMRLAERRTTTTREAGVVDSGLVIGLSPEVQCTRPIYDLSGIANADEMCFEASDLELKKGDEVPSTQEIGYNGQPLKKWRFNRQSGRRFCYVYSPTGQYPQF